VAIDSGPRRDIYVVMVGLDESGLAQVSVFVNPLVMWLWIAGVLIAIGAVIAAWPPPRDRPQEAAVPSRSARAQRA
jgi:cytochrome c-type biogenesis protein CcmF